MLARDVYRELRQALDPWFREHGFRKLAGSRLAYVQAVDDGHRAVWFQLDRWGWDAYAGSSFFVNFRVAPGAGLEGPYRREERLNHFLTDEELEAARVLRDAIVARIPRPPDAYFQQLEEATRRFPDGAEMLAALHARLEPEPLPYRRHQDFGLRYHEPADVVAWADFIRPVLGRATAEMGSW